MGEFANRRRAGVVGLVVVALLVVLNSVLVISQLG